MATTGRQESAENRQTDKKAHGLPRPRADEVRLRFRADRVNSDCGPVQLLAERIERPLQKFLGQHCAEMHGCVLLDVSVSGGMT